MLFCKSRLDFLVTFLKKQRILTVFMNGLIFHDNIVKAALIGCFVIYSHPLKSFELPDDIDQLNQQQSELLKLDINDLLNVQVTSVSKKKQKVSRSAAAVFVITQRDIKQSGVTSIADALRMAPGINVARIDDNEWAISSRGANGRFANKLLVLIDGRSVYTPFFSGVNWDVQDTILEDIARIEVIRGPGASLWGSNAVNGVINIITQSATETQGTYLSAGGGTMEKVFGSARHGGKINENAHYRLYAKYFEREMDNNWRMGRGGGRLDWQLSKTDELTIQGDIYEGETGDTINLPSVQSPYNQFINTHTQQSGGNILLRWKKQIEPGQFTALQIYFDYTEKDAFELRQEHSTFDVDFQHHFSLNSEHNLTWGAGYRFISDDMRATFMITPEELQKDVHHFNFFIQEEWRIIENELSFTIGSKFEHNYFSGFEIQPSARIVWQPHQEHSVWASVSRAVRTSSRAEQGGVINQQTIPPSPASMNLPVLVSLTGSIGSASEELLAYEIGYRAEYWDQLFVDLSAFYFDYDNLRNFHPGAPEFAGTHLSQPIYLQTDMNGESYGAELALSWQAMDNLRLNATYSFVQIQYHTENGRSNVSEDEENQTPHHQFNIRSSLKINSSWDWDMWLRYADTVEDFDIPSYLTMDARLAWKPVKNIELSVIGQNLLDGKHPEFSKNFLLSRRTQIERGVYGKVEWRF